MNLSKLAFEHRKLVLLTLVVLLVYGAVSYVILPAREDPEITIREAVVITRYPGLSPKRVEELITRKLEEQIRKIPEIEEIRSTSTTGVSIIHVEIHDRYFDLAPIWQNLRNKVAAARGTLPEGSSAPRVNDEYGDVAVLTLALTAADGFTLADLYDMGKHIRDVLYGEPGTKKIDMLGVQDERIFLELSNARLAQLGISPLELVNILQSQNIIRPGGQLDTGSRSFIIEPTGNFDSVSAIGETLVSLPGSEDVVPLSDLVNISRGFVDPPYQTSYFNGEPAIIFAISMLSGVNVLDYAPRMRARIEAVGRTLPVGFFLEIVTNQAEQVAKTVYGVSSSVVQTLVIVLIVVMLFLGIRTGLIVGTIVPFVMLVTLAIMHMTGMALERMSLATLIIALGLLVDNGIVIAEDFKRRLEAGADRAEALHGTGAELAVPLLISSLTTILVFLPLMLAEHVAGEFTRSISLVILITLLVSWVLALGVTPVLCFYFLRVRPVAVAQTPSAAIRMLYGGYESFLHWVLQHRRLFLGLMLSLLVGAGALMAVVPKQFFPDSDRAQILVYVELPSDTSARTTDRRMQDIFAWLNQEGRFPDITSFVGYAGYGGPRFVLSLSPEDPADNKGFIVINVDDLDAMPAVLEALRAGFRDHFPDMLVRVTRMFLGPSDSSKLQIQVKGPDADVIYAQAKAIEALFRAIPGTTDIRTDWENRITKVVVRVDQQRARRAAVTSEDIARSMNAHFNGVVVTEYREGSDIIPIVLRASEGERFSLDRMRSMNVISSARGVTVPLFQIADFEPYNQYSRIARENMFRTVTVETRSLVSTAEDLRTVMDPELAPLRKALPLNHSIEYDGVITDSKGAQQALSANLPMVIGLIILLLVAQFNSYRRAAIIFLTIPLALIGAVPGLLVSGSFFGFMVTLGLYSLAGIIINNAIVLIDRIDIERAAGVPGYEAIVNACLMRLRPIAMTTITTVLGLMPLIIGRDPLFYGMANAMAFGLGVGTILTLGVVPALFSLLFAVTRAPIAPKIEAALEATLEE